MESFDIDINYNNGGSDRLTLTVVQENGPTRAGSWVLDGVITGTFLAHTDEDLMVLNQALPQGPVTDPTVYVLSGGSRGSGITGTISLTTDNGTRPRPFSWRRR